VSEAFASELDSAASCQPVDPLRSRGRTESLRSLRRHLSVVNPELEAVDVERPRTRGDCVDGPRPCPYVGCAHNLFLESTDLGSLKFPFADREPWDVPPEWSCALDVADRGGASRVEVGRALNLTTERVRQIVDGGLSALRGERELSEFAPEGPAPLERNQGTTAPAAADPPAEESSPEVERWADEVRADGVPMATAGSLAGGVDPSQEEETTMSTNGATMTLAERIARVEAEKAALREMIEVEEARIREQAAALEEARRALGEPSRDSDDASSMREPSPKASERRKPGRPPTAGTRRARIVAYVSSHPGETTGQIAAALSEDSRRIAVELHGLKQACTLVATGPKSAQVWSAP